MFGEELGSVLLKNITSVKPCDNPTPDVPESRGYSYFQFEAKEEGAFIDTVFTRLLRAESRERRDDWVR